MDTFAFDLLQVIPEPTFAWFLSRYLKPNVYAVMEKRQLYLFRRQLKGKTIIPFFLYEILKH